MRFEYWKSGDGDWSWQLKSPLGEVLARGEPAATKEVCLSYIKFVKLAAGATCREVTLRVEPSLPAPYEDSELYASPADPV